MNEVTQEVGSEEVRPYLIKSRDTNFYLHVQGGLHRWLPLEQGPSRFASVVEAQETAGTFRISDYMIVHENDVGSI